MNELPIHEFLDYVAKEQLFNVDERILLAVSGGKDSVFMAHLFAQTDIKFGIAHGNFQLRGKDSDADEQFVRSLAKDLHVDFFSTKFNTLQYGAQNKVSTQMAARTLRFEWFEHLRTTQRYDKIAIAQHQTDVVETMLLNLIRGTGIAGLHGILPKRDFIIRPLLFLTSAEIQEKITAASIPFREDVSNTHTKYKRNALRHQVLPVLRKLNPALESTFLANAKRFYASEKIIETHITRLRKALFVEKDGCIEIPLEKLSDLWEPQMLFELLKCFNFTEAVLSDLVAATGNGSGKLFYSDTHELVLDRSKLVISKKKENGHLSIEIASLPALSEFFNKTYKLFYSKDVTIEHNPLRLKMDADKIALPLTMRSWKLGDRFRPLGMEGKKKVSDYLISKKIPVSTKQEIPLLVDADENIISIGTIQLDDRYKITVNTEKVLIFEQL